MKKLFCLAIVIVCCFSVFASWTAGASLGLLNTVNVGYDFGFGEVNAKICTSALTGGLAVNAFIEDGFKTGNSLLHGLAFDACFTIFEKNRFCFEAGPDIKVLRLSYEDVKSNLVLFGLSAEVDFDINEKNSVNFCAGMPLLLYVDYLGKENNHNYVPFDFWAFVPTAVREVEEGNWLDEGMGKKINLVLYALNVRFGYTYRF